MTHLPSDVITLTTASKAFLSHSLAIQAEPCGLIIKTPSPPTAAATQGLGVSKLTGTELVLGMREPGEEICSHLLPFLGCQGLAEAFPSIPCCRTSFFQPFLFFPPWKIILPWEQTLVNPNPSFSNCDRRRQKLIKSMWTYPYLQQPPLAMSKRSTLDPVTI